MRNYLRRAMIPIVLTLGLVLVMGIAALAQVTWISDASGKINLLENISDNGDGTWTYNYTIQNVGESLPIWFVIVYHNLPGQRALTPSGDATHVGWMKYWGSCYYNHEIGSPEGQNFFTYTRTEVDNWPNSTPNGVALGQSLKGFSFTSAVYDPSSKRFVYDRQGDWGGGNLGFNEYGSQRFSGGGKTSAVPEPSTLHIFGTMGLSLAGMVIRRRR